MKFKVDWHVEDHSDEGVKIISSGSVIKDAADAAAMQAIVDSDLIPALKNCYAEEMEHSSRSYHATITAQ